MAGQIDIDSSGVVHQNEGCLLAYSTREALVGLTFVIPPSS